MNRYGSRIRAIRKHKGLSQLQLEVLIGASFGSISRIENGLTNPTKETIFAIINSLQLTLEEAMFLFHLDVLKTQSNPHITSKSAFELE